MTTAKPARDFRRQLAEDYPTLLKFYVPLFLFFSVIVAATWSHGIPPSYLLRDPSASENAPFYVGFFSNVGVLAWCIGATASLVAYAVIRRQSGPSEWTKFFLFGGAFTAFMCLDDLFLFHEEIFPIYIFSKKGLVHFHMSEMVIYASYGLTALIFLIKCRATILKTDYMFLYIALFFLSMSLIVEAGLKRSIVASYEIRQLFEDGFKFLGIVGWAFYFVVASYRALANRTQLSR